MPPPTTSSNKHQLFLALELFVQSFPLQTVYLLISVSLTPLPKFYFVSFHISKPASLILAAQDFVSQTVCTREFLKLICYVSFHHYAVFRI